MAVDGSEKIYTVDSTFSNLFSSSLNAMAIRETLSGISLDNMTMVTVEEKGGTFTFSRSGPGDGAWNVSEKIGTERPADTGLVSGCLGKLVKLRYEEMTVYRPSEGQMEEYGLAGRDTGSLIRIAYQDNSPRRGKQMGFRNSCSTLEKTAGMEKTPMCIRKADRESMRSARKGWSRSCT